MYYFILHHSDSCSNYSFLFFFPCRAQDEKHSQEVSRFQEELSEAHSQLQILQKQLEEELDKQPLTHQEVGGFHHHTMDQRKSRSVL